MTINCAALAVVSHTSGNETNKDSKCHRGLFRRIVGKLQWLKGSMPKKCDLYSVAGDRKKSIRKRKRRHLRSARHIMNLRMLCKKQQGTINRLIQENDCLHVERDDFAHWLHDADNEIARLRFLYVPGSNDFADSDIGPMQPDILEEVGQQVGDYKLGKQLGKGGFGEV
ncbi:expressed unknown protein [Seminavis robusta]|uniref:Uncharacterized protein n=1 Tax=Seminavis robusta TaxID=568900 RepID=A0A9N8DJ63_9STRA|nr:expressed unknown protein [Seminavis robusta]|eukprot:Sro173_g076180.1 n/a (169) ;mRNA; f:16671-17177